MRHRLVIRNKDSMNRRAGASLHAQEVRGRHSPATVYRVGDNWAECQRCGFDVYASDLVEDGYKPGLMVCTKCYDPPHPQDYVRVLEDDTSPIFSTGANTETLDEAVEGSTEVPGSTLTGPTDFDWGEV